jgi:hypothetical protein
MKTKFFSSTGILPAILAFILIIVSCDVIGEQGSGKIARQERKVAAFTGIDVSGAFNVYLSQGTEPSVIVEADDNLLDIIKTEVKGGILVVETTKPIHHSSKLKVFVTFTELKSIEISGAVDVESVTRLNLPELMISSSGAADGKLEMDVQKLSIECSGGSKMKLTGSAKDVVLDASGAIDLDAFDFPAENYKVTISGAGKANINVSKELKVDISGAANVRYKGNPTKNIQDISGAGSVKKVDL